MRHPSKGVCDTFGEGIANEDTVAAIVTKGRPEVEAIDSMRCIGVSIFGLLVDKDATARRRNGSLVEVVLAENLSIGGEERVDAGSAK